MENSFFSIISWNYISIISLNDKKLFININIKIYYNGKNEK